eukprot:scaffold3504_cov240-Pinguiococcus_pyrenoidosus.AAC.24
MPVKAAASWFPRIAGIVCTVSAIAGAAVKPISSWFGSTHQLVFITAGMLSLATIVSNEAFRRAPGKIEQDISAARQAKEVQKVRGLASRMASRSRPADEAHGAPQATLDAKVVGDEDAKGTSLGWISRRMPRIFLVAQRVFEKR